jgi:putative flippase GtrA
MLVFRYSLFAAIATLLNLASQALSFYFYTENGAIYLAMAIGTLTGLICKYYLDKHFIFGYRTQNKSEDFFTFILYSLMGVITTLIFWATELGFDYFFNSHLAKYAGAVIGLAMGYFIKYKLDKKYVFVGNPVSGKHRDYS